MCRGMTKLAVVVSCAVFQVFPLSQTERFSSRDGFRDITNHASHDHPKSAMHDFVLKLVVTDLKSVDQLFGNSLRSNHKIRWPTGDTAFTKRKHCK